MGEKKSVKKEWLEITSINGELNAAIGLFVNPGVFDFRGETVIFNLPMTMMHRELDTL